MMLLTLTPFLIVTIAQLAADVLGARFARSAEVTR